MGAVDKPKQKQTATYQDWHITAGKDFFSLTLYKPHDH